MKFPVLMMRKLISYNKTYKMIYGLVTAIQFLIVYVNEMEHYQQLILIA